jgi:hypothetical protein
MTSADHQIQRIALALIGLAPMKRDKIPRVTDEAFSENLARINFLYGPKRQAREFDCG